MLANSTTAIASGPQVDQNVSEGRDSGIHAWGGLAVEFPRGRSPEVGSGSGSVSAACGYVKTEISAVP